MGVQETIDEAGPGRAKFREMKQGTADDWAIIGGEYRARADEHDCQGNESIEFHERPFA